MTDDIREHSIPGSEPSPEPAAKEGARPDMPRPDSPLPRPVPRPPAPRPAPPTPASTTPATPPVDAVEAAEAARWGRVDDDNTVWVREAAGERSVGQYPDANAADALAYFVRKFLELQAQVTLFETRLANTDLSVKEIDTTIAKLADALAEPAAVGDLDGLRTRLDALRAVAAERRQAAEEQAQAAKAEAVAARTAIVEQAEALAARDPERTHWRQAGEELRVLLDQWKSAQASGPRISRATEEALWKRFSAARTTFDRNRRHFFAALEERNAAAKAAKEALVAEAEALATSTDWGATAGAYRDLMAQWKKAGHAGRAADDALWQRFRAAQDTFFAARNSANAQLDSEFAENLERKLALLTEAETLVPIKDLAVAKASLRVIQDKWDAIGRVPRSELQSVEARLRAVEQAIRAADEEAWTRSNPETKARVEGMTRQLEEAIASLEQDLVRAQEAGDTRKVAEAQQALDARRSWLTQIQGAQDL